MAKPLSTWQVIAQDIEREIKAHRLSPGDRLPTEMELARKFMVNRHTVRRALLDLQAKQVVQTTQGRGTFVRAKSVTYRLDEASQFTENLLAQNRVPSVETRIASIKRATPKIAEALEIEEGADVSFLERIGFADDEPIGISNHYFSYERFPPFLRLYQLRQSVTKTLNELGSGKYKRARTVISSRLPTGQESKLLNVPKHVPMLVTEGIDANLFGCPIGFVESRVASDRVVLEL
jgi:GntR family phosphonate transport system transcriptional regulator